MAAGVSSASGELEPSGRPYSQIRRAGPLVVVAGQTAVDANDDPIAPGDVTAQTLAVIERIEALLATESVTLAEVVKTTVFLADFADFAAMNAAYRQRFSAPYPARATVQVGLVRPEFRVEIDALAVVT